MCEGCVSGRNCRQQSPAVRPAGPVSAERTRLAADAVSVPRPEVRAPVRAAHCSGPSQQPPRDLSESVPFKMAFMMPVVKNDWNIYKSGRSRRSSECSNPQSCRSRKVSECKSEGPSLSTSPGSEFVVVSVKLDKT